MMKYSLEEQETHIYYEPLDKVWIFESTYLPHIKRLIEFKQYMVEQETEGDRTNYIKLEIPANELLINPFPKKHRQLSERQRAKMRQQLQNNLKGVDK